ncbi:MAG: HAMP domain-containing methyl-accepting chemotaxis protein [Bacillota bacterium]
MRWIGNLSIFGKVFFLALVLLVFLAGTGIYAVVIINGISHWAEGMYQDRVVPIDQWGQMKALVIQIAWNLTAHIQTDDPAEKERLEKDISQRAAEFNRIFSEYKQTKLVPEEEALLEKFENELREYWEAREETLKLSRNAAENKIKLMAFFNSRTELARQRVVKLTDEMVELNRRLAQEVHAENQRIVAATVINLMIILIGAIALALLMSFFLGRMMSRSLKTLEEAAGKVAEGDLSVKWEIRSKDEIGSLSASLSKMVQNLRLVVQRVHEAATNVAASAEELTASTEQSAQVAAQITQAAQELASGADRQNDKVQSTLATIEQASAATEQIAATAQEVAASAQDTSQRAKEGNKAMVQAMEEMSRINHSTTEVAGTIKKLGSRSQAIGQIVDVISSIADQTNLLALNAAIEAARAGDHGRGFAVVAEEVRKLAEQSSQAAGEIASLIRQIQGETGKAVQAMDNNSRLVEGGSKVISEGAAAFRQIEQAVENVAQQLAEVSRSTEELAKGSEEMVNAIKVIEEVTQQVAAASQEMASGTEEQSASIEEVAASADSLARLGQELQQAIAGFKL